MHSTAPRSLRAILRRIPCNRYVSAIAGTGLLAVTVAATPAAARLHIGLASSTPAKDSHVTTAPRELRLTFTGTIDVTTVARALENRRIREAPADAWMRANDHQMIEPLYVSVMRRAGEPGVKFDNEGSGYGFKTVMELPASKVALPSTCRMARQR